MLPGLTRADAAQAECTSPAALESFRQSPPVAQFLKRWNLTAYFSLRLQARPASLPAVVAVRRLRCLSAAASQEDR